MGEQRYHGLIQLMVGAPAARYEGEMERVAELEQLGRTAKQQAGLTSNRETRELLLQIARQYAVAAAERRAVVGEMHSGPLSEHHKGCRRKQVE